MSTSLVLFALTLLGSSQDKCLGSFHSKHAQCRAFVMTLLGCPRYKWIALVPLKIYFFVADEMPQCHEFLPNTLGVKDWAEDGRGWPSVPELWNSSCIGGHICPTSGSAAVIKYPHEKQPREKGLISAHATRSWSIIVGNSRWELQAASHITSPTVKSREKKCLNSCLPEFPTQLISPLQ